MPKGPDFTGFACPSEGYPELELGVVMVERSTQEQAVSFQLS